jgi:hypothetical protein
MTHRQHGDLISLLYSLTLVLEQPSLYMQIHCGKIMSHDFSRMSNYHHVQENAAVITKSVDLLPKLINVFPFQPVINFKRNVLEVWCMEFPPCPTPQD